jgi:hypothetical protein
MAEDAAQNITPAADGYYGDDDSTNEEIDLSFLDEDEKDPTK